jgi:hypothetical protein
MQKKKPTPERLLAFFEWGLAAVRRSAKDGEGMEVLIARLRGTG